MDDHRGGAAQFAEYDNDPDPRYSRSRAIELLHIAGCTRFEAINITRDGPEAVRKYIEQHPDKVFSEYLVAQVGAET